MTAPKLSQKSRRIFFRASALLAISVGGSAAIYAADTVNFDFGGSVRQGVRPAAGMQNSLSEPNPLPSNGVPSTGTVISSAPLDLSGIDLAPGETLVTPGAPVNSNSNYAAASQGYAQPTTNNRSSGGYGQCPTYPDKRYVIAEALYMKRSGDEGLTYSDRFQLDQFDYQLGMRLTAGFIMEGTEGVDISYTGLLSWSDQASYSVSAPVVTDPDVVDRRRAMVNIGFSPDLDAVAFRGFRNATQQTQQWDANFQSFELNMRNWAWDVVSVLHGVRMIRYDEDFLLTSQGTINDALGNALPQINNSLQTKTQNVLLGLQVGLDMLYPVTCSTDMGMRMRAGGFVDFAESNFAVANSLPANAAVAGGVITNLNDRDQGISGMFEIGSYITQQLTPCLSVRAGYEFWYLANIATVAGNTPGVLSPALRGNVNNDDDVMFNGFTIGGELKW